MLTFKQIAFIVLLFIYLFFIRKKIKLLGMIIVFLVIGNIYFFNNMNVTYVDEKATVVDVIAYEKYNRVYFKFSKFQLIYYDYNKTYQISEIYKIDAHIKPFKGVRIPLGFDEEMYYKGQNVYGIADIESISFIGKDKVYILKKKISDYLLQLPKTLSNYADAFIFNHNQHETIQETFSRNQLFFMISITGIHLFMIIKGLRFVLFYFNVPEKYQNVSILLFYIVFGLISGFGYFILRLVFKTLIESLLKFFDIRLNRLNILHLTMMFIILLKPYIIFNQGFIMYALILHAMILILPLYQNQSFFIKRLISSLLIQTTLSVFVNQINLLIIVLSPILMELSVILFMLVIASLFIPHIWDLMLPIIETITQFIETINAQPFAVINIGTLTLSCIFLAIVCFYLIFRVIKKTYQYCLSICFMIILLIPIMHINVFVDPTLYILDVEQGDSSVFLANDCVMVVDAYQNVSTFLKNHGVQQIDLLIVSHSDNDHFKEVPRLLKTLKVKKLVMSIYDQNIIDFSSLVYVKNNDQLTCGKGKIEIYSPSKNYQNKNDNSIVFKFTYEMYEMLFTGDISKKVELELVEQYGKKLKADFLKIAHHGSETSSDELFLKTVNPKWASMSLKQDNSYLFPSQYVIKRLNKLKIEVYRTDQHATIIFNIRRKRIKTVV